MAIDIQQEDVDGTRVLALGGRLDTETSADVELTLQDLLAAGERNFLIDMSGIGYVSSAGLRVLLATAKQLEGGKGSLRLCALNASVKQVFDVAGFSRLFSIFPTRDAALGSPPKVKKAQTPKPDVARPDKAEAPRVEPKIDAPLAASNVEAARPAPARSVPPPASPKNDEQAVGVVLAQKIASLWGLKLINETPHAQAAELGRLATELLGVKPAIAGGILPKPPRDASASAVVAPTEKPDDGVAKGGVVGKLRGLFGKR